MTDTILILISAPVLLILCAGILNLIFRGPRWDDEDEL